MGSRVSLIGWCPALNRLRYCWSVSCLCQADINVVSTVQALIHCQLVYSITWISWPPLVHSMDTRCWRSTLVTWLTGWECHIYSMCVCVYARHMADRMGMPYLQHVCVCMLGTWLTGWERHIYSMCVCTSGTWLTGWERCIYSMCVCVC